MSTAPDAPAVVQSAPGAAEPERLTPWRARMLRRASSVDVAYCAGVLALAALTIWSGRVAGRHLSPDGAQTTARLLDELELPRVLPNAVLVRDDGTETRLWELTSAPRTILTFYAPWCAPCQEELPKLVHGTAGHSDRLAVVVGPDEDQSEVRKQLDNLGLKDLRFHVDARREVEAGGRVSALPTTFLMGRMGTVQERIVGYSEFRLQMLIMKARTGQDFRVDDDN